MAAQNRTDRTGRPRGGNLAASLHMNHLNETMSHFTHVDSPASLTRDAGVRYVDCVTYSWRVLLHDALLTTPRSTRVSTYITSSCWNQASGYSPVERVSVNRSLTPSPDAKVHERA